MAQHPAIHHDHQRARGRGDLVGGTGGAPRLRLLLGARPGKLHLPMNARVIHRHTPLGGDSRRLFIGSGRSSRETKLLGQAGRDLLMRQKSPGLLLGTNPLLRLDVLTVINGQLDQTQFGA